MNQEQNQRLGAAAFDVRARVGRIQAGFRSDVGGGGPVCNTRVFLSEKA